MKDIRIDRSINSDIRRAKTIALFTTGAIDPNNHTIWSGVDAACRDAGVNLICYPGRLVGSPIEFEAQRNVIYQMIDPQMVDGLIMMGGLNAWLDKSETYAFLNQFSPLPIVTTGIVLDGIPGVTVDNYHGMYNVITHLVTVHNRRRIAFIRGQANHQEAYDRYQAYLDVLKEYQIPFDPDLVYQGDFKESGGVSGVKILLDERKVSFNALVAASDNMAIGALKTLKACGLRVPADVAIAGLNGEDQGLVINPPLTTAPLHFYEQGYQAATMVLSLIEGKEVPAKVLLPTRLVIRQSCGCSDPLVTHAKAIPHTEKLDSFTEEIRLLYRLIFGDEELQLQFPDDEPVQQAFPVLLKLFLSESQGKSEGEFLTLFEETLVKSANSNDAFPRWHEIISILRQFSISQLSDTKSRLRIENLIQQARVVIGESARRHNAYQLLEADSKLHILGEISQIMSVATSIVELKQALERSLVMLNIPRCYLFLYENPEAPEDLARMIFAFDGQKQIDFDEDNIVIPTQQLIPFIFLSGEKQHRLVVEPIYFREDQLGYAIFEADPKEEAIYEILGGQISASLKRTILTERNIRLYDEALEARKAAEQADLLKSRFLSMVSHELRTPLALIVGTIEMMLQEQQSDNQPPLPDNYREDMDVIYTSSKHLSWLIGDVLDLASNQAGELRLTQETLDLPALFDEIAILGKSLARDKGLEWRERIPTNLPPVWGDRTRLRQVIINLITNAIKFTESGYVSLVVNMVKNKINVEVSDTGMGIPLEDQLIIFDEFRRSERSVARGYGGIGLGLAITRRLIELHGGEIGVRSSGMDNNGSTFFFTLPVIEDSPRNKKNRDNRKNVVLLLIESESNPSQLEQHLLEKGFEVEVVDITNQKDWMDQVIAQPPGALVLDFQPAKERGWELMQLIKQNIETKDIPVIFYNLPESQANGGILELDYLTKPIGRTDLAQVLNRLKIKSENKLHTILIVDDDPKVLDMHARMLDSLSDCKILKANGGKKALEIIRRENLSLVLLDLMMPEVDGFQVLREMQNHETSRNIPVIVLSAQILTTHDMMRLQEGVAVVLGKGLFTAEEVLAQVEAALSHSKRLGTPTSRSVREAMNYIHQHYHEPISRSVLAEHVAITERYLTLCFRQELGITPMMYLNRYRVKQAKLLLAKGNQSITDVALDVGFSDSSYFNRVFKQETGITPGAFQRGERSGNLI